MVVVIEPREKGLQYKDFLITLHRLSIIGLFKINSYSHIMGDKVEFTFKDLE